MGLDVRADGGDVLGGATCWLVSSGPPIMYKPSGGGAAVAVFRPSRRAARRLAARFSLRFLCFLVMGRSSFWVFGPYVFIVVGAQPVPQKATTEEKKEPQSSCAYDGQMSLGRASLVCGLLLLAAAGCGDDRPAPLAHASSTGTQTKSCSSGTSGSQGGGGQAGGHGGGQGGAGAASAGGGAPLKIEILDEGLVIDCQPGAVADPISGDFLVEYDNSLGTTTAAVSIQSCRLTLDAGNTLTWYFKASPAEVSDIAAGTITTEKHIKVADSGNGSGTGEPCDYCFKPQQLTVTFLLDGKQVSHKAAPEGSYCSY